MKQQDTSLPCMATSIASMAATKRKLGDLSMDEFMAGDFDSDDSSSSEPASVPEVQTKKNKNKKKKKPKETAKMTQVKENPTPLLKKVETKESNPDKSKGKKKQSLAEKLKKQDPEFYKFLESEDQDLLEFDEDVDEDDDEEDDEAEFEDDDEEEEEEFDEKALEKQLLAQSSEESSSSDDDDEESGGKFHKPPDKLEVASDDSEAEDEMEGAVKTGKLTKVTTKMVKQWTLAFQKNPTINILREAISAFKAAVKKAGDKEGETIKYKVAGGTVFNAVVRMCLMEVVPALQHLLKVPDLMEQQTPFSGQNAKWKKIRVDVKSYLNDLLTLLTSLSDAAMLNVILKHIHRLVSIYASFPKVARTLMKSMVVLWSTGEETTRVLAFLCINKLVRMLRETMLEGCMKQLYMAYVKNVKFTSPTTLPLINFMQRSLVEVFLLDPVLAYQYAFIYIRQLAIHLRNAITVKKKDTCQAVYNWQFMHCLELWVSLLSTSPCHEVLRPLIYPLSQTIIGTLKLLPSPRYFPLRFHCVRCLHTLGKTTDTFIPVLPFLLEVFELTDFNKKHKSVSFKPFNLACILKFTKKQQEEKVFKDGLIDQLYELLLENFNTHGCSIGFPELVLPAVLQLKDFLKKCKIANYCKQIKQIVDKVEENVKFITQRRKPVTFSISDDKAVELWERETSSNGTPLTKFYTGWRKLRDRELQHEIAGKDRISLDDNKIPTIERPKGPRKATAEDRKKFSELFDTDSDESMDDETRFLPRNERPAKKEKKKKEAAGSDDEEDYSDFDSDELEQLAKSASEDEDDDDDDDEEDEDDDDDSDEGSKGTPKARKQTTTEDDSDPDLEDVVEDFEMSDFDED